ncbi:MULTISPECIES: DeoR/GlpR family DNA-binding transcription regulator [unclassified Pseudomonas]|uniref:DeoR/GlpR family DNA-binding transcription regulator n=1 Tax=unclassified Pseudomonas TaxID=196821 RepID=UPI0025F43FEE|nr:MULTISPECIES: DeoR/GlpR family DNA-binding transcription regulator [unclassified Pseudomonas]
MLYGEASQRRQAILELLRERGVLAIPDIVESLGVSPMTVRRDLQLLDEQGFLQRTRGAVGLKEAAVLDSFKTLPPDKYFEVRSARQMSGKQMIARLATQFVEPADSIGLDAGTTALAVAHALPASYVGTVVTHSIPCLDALMNAGNAQVIALGGDLHRPSRAMVGPSTTERASQLRLRTFFLGAAAMDEKGIYVSADIERETKLALMRVADQVVLLADNSKCALSAAVRLCGFEVIDRLITDLPLPEPLAHVLKLQQVKVDIAG